MSFLLFMLYLLFATIVFGVYLLLPAKAKPYCLLIFSLIFYVVYSKLMTVFLILTIISIYLGGIGINKLNDKFSLKKEGLDKEQKKVLKKKFSAKKRWLMIGIILFNLSILGVLKYFNFFVSCFEGFLSWFNVSANLPILKIILPLGISYYTLSAIGYLIDVNRGKYRAGNFLDVALFISYFPQLFEGPFARFDKLAPQLVADNKFDKKNFFGGLITMLWGYFKKFVVADRLSIIVSEVFANYYQYNGIVVVLGVILFTIQLYAEFSGIIDIARGTSKLFGINLSKNFEQPFFSQSVAEFWRRWHISLGDWLKEYVFFSVSMSKGMLKLNKKLQGKVNTFFQVLIPSAISLLAVWLICGIWHGAGSKYIVYGLYYYVLMILGMCFEPLFNLMYSKFKINKDHLALKILRILRTFILINIGMLLFRADTLSIAFEMFCGMFKSYGYTNMFALGIIDIYDISFCVIGIVAIVVVDVLLEKKIDIKTWFISQHYLIKYAILILLILIPIIFGAYGEGYIPPDPMYGNF